VPADSLRSSVSEEAPASLTEVATLDLRPPRESASEREGVRERILDVAIRLAEEGGFENVKQRDVASQAGVALGTLYKSFRGKEDILSAALDRGTTELERRMRHRPVRGDSPAERLGSLFDTLTWAILDKPNYARAVLRAMTSGDEVAGHVVAHQSKVTRMVLAALRGRSLDDEEPPTPDELTVALLLQQIWFAALVGWSAGLTGQDLVITQVREAARLLVAGLEAASQKRM
jgi:AcrR family transcriptional regulator